MVGEKSAPVTMVEELRRGPVVIWNDAEKKCQGSRPWRSVGRAPEVWIAIKRPS